MSTQANKKEKKTLNTMKLEDAMRRLDEVVAALDSEQTDLEQALALYEEGVGLVRVCRDRLEKADRTIRMLRLLPDGEIAEVEMDTGESGDK